MNIIAFIVAIVVLIIFLKILMLPMKIIIKFIINSIMGGLILLACSFFGIEMVITWWMVILTGLFGVPGFVMALIISMII